MRYRVSHVESFRQWEADEESEVQDLVSRILGLEPPSARMEAGTAFHKALEVATPGAEVETLCANGYTFTFKGDFEVRLPLVRELRAGTAYMVDGRPITISGQVDGIEGRRIDDHKTTGRFDPERYLDGYQWRLYLDIFGADAFRWNVFEIGETDDPFHYEVFAQHTLEQFRYPTLGADCQALVERFARFAREYIEPAWKKAA